MILDLVFWEWKLAKVRQESDEVLVFQIQLWEAEVLQASVGCQNVSEVGDDASAQRLVGADVQDLDGRVVFEAMLDACQILVCQSVWSQEKDLELFAGVNTEEERKKGKIKEGVVLTV